MIRNIVFDFVGVITDIDFKKIFNELSFKEKIKALRLYVACKHGKKARAAFDAYQTGELTTDQLNTIAETYFPTCKGLINKLSNAVIENAYVNKNVLSLIDQLRKDGFKVFLLSNSTPETEKLIETNGLREHFDDLILSTEIGLLKPDPSIFNYVTNAHNISPVDTFFVDDTEENLETATRLGFKIIPCSSSNETFYEVGHRFYTHYQDFAVEDKNIEEEPEKE